MIKGEKFKKVFEALEVADYEALLGLLKFRRSIRGFNGDPVSRKMIEKILEAGRWAPSGGNAQPWEFVVVENKDTIQQLAELYEFQRVEKRWLEGTRKKRMQILVGGQRPDFEKQKIVDRFKKDIETKEPFRNAGCIIFPLADERWAHAYPLRTRLERGHQHIISSLATAVFAMHLAAASLDLATQWVSDFESPWLSGMTRHLLDIPQHFLIYEAIAVGTPTYYPKPRYVKPMDELVHYGKYDATKNRTEEEIQEYIATHLNLKLKNTT
jgi:nitroreductase